MESWGVCHDCGNGLLMAVPGEKRFECPRSAGPARMTALDRDF